MTFRPWKPAEELAFTRFQTANALAEALSADDEDELAAARDAMKGIGHVKSSFYDWMESDSYFAERASDILFIGLQEVLDADLKLMKRMGIVPVAAELPTDEVRAHRIPASFDQRLSPKAVRNLEEWYSADVAFYRRCLDWRVQHLPEAITPP